MKRTRDPALNRDPAEVQNWMRNQNLEPVKLERKVLEKDVEAAVCKYAKTRGLIVRKYSTPNHVSSPDRIFFGPDRLCFMIEFKRPGVRSVTAAQQQDHDKYRRCGFHVYVCNDIDEGKRIIDKEFNP